MLPANRIIRHAPISDPKVSLISTLDSHYNSSKKQQYFASSVATLSSGVGDATSLDIFMGKVRANWLRRSSGASMYNTDSFVEEDSGDDDKSENEPAIDNPKFADELAISVALFFSRPIALVGLAGRVSETVETFLKLLKAFSIMCIRKAFRNGSVLFLIAYSFIA
ncbi:uncharacterized protein UV8b_07914 [Ustilaginoidea virens]|uniref:Uncharacterized protein n=1 Tax=Ustilaginoidea virens TaxID=1159556 RepID=A0A8E5MKH7_USTVR|nr:uncharacterized protein UV8b_07914 [Ustilaginoidea virens]QUC23673.1 hypothetical protein UV8b_07914 [Ustilaginoidea virens]